RMVTTHLSLRAGYGVPRYVSIEQQVFETKNAYYAALRQSQRGWHDSAHDPWPWLTYLVKIFADAYAAFEGTVQRAAEQDQPRTKQGRARQHILEHGPAEFTIGELRRALPGVSDQTFRIVLGELRDEGLVKVDGTGRGARWARVD
ncbi:MAG: Fic family protein, partial [Gaiellales bacterium]